MRVEMQPQEWKLNWTTTADEQDKSRVARQYCSVLRSRLATEIQLYETQLSHMCACEITHHRVSMKIIPLDTTSYKM